MKYLCLPAVLILVLLTGTAAADQTLLLRQPDLSQDLLTFVYAGDIWVAERDGSAPRRLTTDPADESLPLFSPDGSMIAFAAEYEDNVDVYVISIDGGQPRRLTWHPGRDTPIGWTPSGQAVAFVSRRETDHGSSAQLYHAHLDGGLPTKVMDARIYRGSYDATGRRLAYMSHGTAYNGLYGGSSGWKGYRGGTTPAIRIMDLSDQTVTTVPGAGATNLNPLWLDGRLYFISDRISDRPHKVYNLFRYDPAGGDVTRVSDETVWDIRTAGGHGSTLVYEAGGRLKSLDLSTGRTDEIVININPDLPQLRPQWQDAGRTLQDAGISPTGKRAVVTARGDVFTVPIEDGSTRNLTATGDRREYTALWSPDGQQVAYIVDGLDGQSLIITDQTGDEIAKTIELGPHFYELMLWTGGDEPRIIYRDNHINLLSVEVDGGDIELISTGTRRSEIEASASPDGNWLAYTFEQPNFYQTLKLLDFRNGKHYTVTDGLADVASPAFSPDGKYLYFAASTNSGPLQVGLNMTSQERPFRAGLYVAVLAADGKSPLLPESGDEADENADDEKGKDDDEKSDDENGDEKADETRIDLEGLSERIVALPVAERNYHSLGVGSDGRLYYVQAVQPGASNEPPGQRASSENALVRFDMKEQETKTVLSGVNGFSISADGKHMLIGQVSGGLATAEISEQLEPKPLDLSGARVLVDPRREWAIIFDEAWRMEKEYFYDPDMHGLDWDAIYDRYRPLVDHVGRREDLNDLLVEMIAEMQVGHNRVGGGDLYHSSGPGCGLLGANLVIDDGRYRLDRVYTGESWNPFLDAPLAVPGNEAHAGEYILAIDGRDLTDRDNIFALLQGTVGQQVTLRVGPRADGKDARDIVVEPIRSEYPLRLWHWIETNRRLVDEATDGRVGYIYLPNTAGAGYTFFNRMFFPQVDKDALIIDERANAGGQAANYITEVLSRRHLSGWKPRDGEVYNTPMGALYGPKVMLIDQDAGSGGDFLPYSFRHLGIGKLIGKRTWGGLIGIFANPLLIDGGVVTVPFFRFYDADHTWTVENQGVAPDIEVELDPIATNRGADSQLQRAITEVMSQLDGFVDPIPDQAPPYPTELGK